jgi:membrane-associated phospholipid phosphatase
MYGAVLADPYLPRYSMPGLAAIMCLTGFTRVHQGAHFPLDAVGGVLIGIGTGAVLNYTFGLPPPDNSRCHRRGCIVTSRR